MEKLKFYLEKYKFIIVVIALVLFLLFSIIYSILNSEKGQVIKPIELKKESKQVKIEEKIKVDIKGFINSPGVYEMNKDDRIIDVINKAEGLSEGANTDYINLSKKITDEMIIIIYSNNEIDKFKEEDKEIIYIEYECECPDNINDACITKDDTVNTNGVIDVKDEEKKIKEENDELISINSGNIDDLTKLSGIGESKAKDIIEYREKNGNFKSLEDIMNVSGIGEKAYSKIKDYIKL